MLQNASSTPKCPDSRRSIRSQDRHSLARDRQVTRDEAVSVAVKLDCGCPGRVANELDPPPEFVRPEERGLSWQWREAE